VLQRPLLPALLVLSVGLTACGAVGSTGSSAADEWILVGAGDISRCGSPEESEATARLLDEIEGTVFTTGDNVQGDGSADEFVCFDRTWGRHIDRMRPAVGNHEYDTPGAEPYYDYFGAAAGERGEGYYSYDLGTWHIVVLNSSCNHVPGGCDRGSPQERWLRADLEANPTQCSLAYWHIPRFSSGEHGNDDDYVAFWEALYEHGAELVITSHDHAYERFAPQTPDGDLDVERGIRQFVVGTGSAKLRDFVEVQPNSEVRNSETSGVLKLTLRADAYEWQFVPVEGQSFTDTGGGGCQ
jgi:hypothetical protein